MTDHVLRPDGTGFYLADGELTVAGSAEQTIPFDQPVDFSITAGLFGDAPLDVVLAGWSSEQSGDLAGVRSVDGQLVLPLRTQRLMLNSLPSGVRVQLRTAAGLQDTEGIWQLTLRFRNHVGSGLTWHASLPAEAFGAGWTAPLADLLTIDERAVGREGNSPTAAEDPPAVSVIHHADDEYYELVVDGQRAGILVYHVLGMQLSITHTVIDQAHRGRGLSWVLIRHALDDLRTRSLTVSNHCAVVQRFAERNPEYGELLGLPRSA
jgi:predicted GNAT family acetyltransferase